MLPLRPVVTPNIHKRIDVRVPPHIGNRQARELIAFSRYCVQRIEKELGERQRWVVAIDLGARGFASHVIVEHHALVLETHGSGTDGALAIWDAMCRIEAVIRERRGCVFMSRATKVAND